MKTVNNFGKRNRRKKKDSVSHELQMESIDVLPNFERNQKKDK